MKKYTILIIALLTLLFSAGCSRSSESSRDLKSDLVTPVTKFLEEKAIAQPIAWHSDLYEKGFFMLNSDKFAGAVAGYTQIKSQILELSSVGFFSGSPKELNGISGTQYMLTPLGKNKIRRSNETEILVHLGSPKAVQILNYASLPGSKAEALEVKFSYEVILDDWTAPMKNENFPVLKDLRLNGRKEGVVVVLKTANGWATEL